jgi:hypothetical protein
MLGLQSESEEGGGARRKRGRGRGAADQDTVRYRLCASGDVSLVTTSRRSIPDLESTECFLAGIGRHSWIACSCGWHNGFPRPPAHLAHAELLRLLPLTLFAPEDNQSSAIALV